MTTKSEKTTKTLWFIQRDQKWQLEKANLFRFQQSHCLLDSLHHGQIVQILRFKTLQSSRRKQEVVHTGPPEGMKASLTSPISLGVLGYFPWFSSSSSSSRVSSVCFFLRGMRSLGLGAWKRRFQMIFQKVVRSNDWFWGFMQLMQSSLFKGAHIQSSQSCSKRQYQVKSATYGSSEVQHRAAVQSLHAMIATRPSWTTHIPLPHRLVAGYLLPHVLLGQCHRHLKQYRR